MLYDYVRDEDVLGEEALDRALRTTELLSRYV